VAGRRLLSLAAPSGPWIDSGGTEGVELLVERLVAGADAGVSELCAGGWSSGCGHGMSMSQKYQNHKYCDETFEATFATGRSGLSSAPVPLALSVSQLKN
jgi:hypothetical protein